MADETFDERDPFAPIQYRYSNVTRLYSIHSRFQEIEVFYSPFFGRMLVLDGVVQLTERDEFLYHEMLAHVPLHSHRAPRRVLIVGGGDGGTLREALKHPTIENVILVELDPQVVETCQRFFPRLAAGFTSPGVTVHHTDGVRYLEETNDRFDVILVDSTDPVGPARGLSELTFFEAAAQVLTDAGVFAIQTESLHFHAGFVNRVQQDLGLAFPSVALYGAPVATYAGNWWTFSVASKAPLGLEPLRLPVEGLRLYCEEVHRKAFISPRVLECFASLD